MFVPVSQKNIRRTFGKPNRRNQEMAGIGDFFKKAGKFFANNAINSGKALVTTFVPGGAAFQGLLDKIPTFGQGGGGSSSGQAKGLQQITDFVNQVLSALDSLKQNAANGEDVSAQADQIAALLSDSSRVYQPKKGKDATALADGKSKAAAKVNEIKSLIQQTRVAVQQQQQQSNNSSNSNNNGSSNNNSNNNSNDVGGSLINGIDNDTLLLIGGAGLVGYLLLIRQYFYVKSL